MKKVFIILLFICLSMEAVACTSYTTVCKNDDNEKIVLEDEKSLINNSFSNINNNGLMITKDNFIFLVNGNNIYKINQENEENTIVIKDRNNISCLTIIDDYIYYIDELYDNSRICRIDLNGNNESVIVVGDSKIRNMIYYKDNIYYVCSNESKSKLCKINIEDVLNDEINTEILFENNNTSNDFKYLNIFNGYFYFVTSTNIDSVYKMDMKSNEKTLIYSDNCIDNFVIKSGSIFYSQMKGDTTDIYKLDLDGENKLLMLTINNFPGNNQGEIRSASWNMDNNIIYYSNFEDNKLKICKFNIDNNEKLDIYSCLADHLNESIYDINVAGDYIYYLMDLNNVVNVNICKNNESCNTKLYNDKNKVIAK